MMVEIDLLVPFPKPVTPEMKAAFIKCFLSIAQHRDSYKLTAIYFCIIIAAVTEIHNNSVCNVLLLPVSTSSPYDYKLTWLQP
jgi:hypothetical protein